MKKGIKKAHPLATKLVDEPCYKRPIHGFCYTHFNMNTDKLLKVWNLDLQTLSAKARNVQALAHTLNKALQSEQLDTEYITDVVNIMEEFAIAIVNKANEIEVEQ
ncbi:hypothetical protein [Leuconostoc mesenteroides]|uniref:hypothetical protein n=1 Tax=Leuconostoc mesenteroides TaxID=1245 RepID=UPI0009FC7DC4|nr:hypothetical protein [Leuconostoc mesenteroides]ORI46691.1 hypothetical protein BMR97_07375 [Leuconostoc mesenteroides subsp. cremoris]ORI48124.1 hypothetical protein BMR95_02085 [Leuconostoc mesenteroides subsp. cremoris]ORI50901.1 hypothetical protein BMR98_02065 [Leuconostoc mesenteroides subsp. cremoris]ORI56538.1 hypothetical protein BMS67_05630 [Leuconostoc mesenteroides subsp. cremoris]ORI58740.1 hypothetical protein BMS68_06680 [Leuconostoc mesenteroides subsp. cremoris]